MRNRNRIEQLWRTVTGIFLVFAPMFFTGNAYAQKEPLYTQYMENLMAINPAYAGSKDLLSMMVVSRNQWVSISEAPVTRTFAANSPINGTNMGLGFSFLSDQAGKLKHTSLNFDYSYTLHFNNRRNLALGLKGGVNFYEARIAGLLTNDPNDPVFASDINRNFLPNFGVGAFYNTDRYYFGISVPQIINNTINKNGFATDHFNLKEISLFFMGGYVFYVNRIVKFKPSVLANVIRNTPVSVSMNGTFLFYDRLWLGAMYRPGDSFGGLFQLQVTDQVKIGYSYDLTISKLGVFSSGTHEIMVSFDFNLNKGKVRSPRYF